MMHARVNYTPHPNCDRRTHMTDEQPRTATGAALTNLQRDRLDFARRDLDDARTVNLTQMSPAALILLVEKLRRRLDDTLRVVDEIAGPPVPTQDQVP